MAALPARDVVVTAYEAWRRQLLQEQFAPVPQYKPTAGDRAAKRQRMLLAELGPELGEDAAEREAS